ncbi:hypothetical protein [Shimwellia pseudoproteus]|uniref:hypothetical protein n=1 Tax=Shimwellia pseudoproteus TaxID=570012 RepID=UPI0018EAE0D3|nr:hypothetical protein [Shimwellia pseudoproteus]
MLLTIDQDNISLKKYDNKQHKDYTAVFPSLVLAIARANTITNSRRWPNGPFISIGK